MCFLRPRLGVMQGLEIIMSKNQNHPNRSANNATGSLYIHAVQMYLYPQAFNPHQCGMKWVIAIRDGNEYLRSDFEELTPTADDQRRWTEKVIEVIRRDPDMPVRIGYKYRTGFRDGGTAPLREIIGAICDFDTCRKAGVMKLATLDGYPVHMRDRDTRKHEVTLGAAVTVTVPTEMIWPKIESSEVVYG